MDDVKSYFDYAYDLINSSKFDYLMDEHYWNDSFNAEEYVDLMEKSAEENGITLTNKDDFDYNKFFWEIYNDSEKGLS